MVDGMMTPRKHSRAFSLVEIAITLAIVALMTGFALKALQPNSDAECYAKTKLQMEDIRAAMETFVRKNNRYPTPASRNRGVNNPYYGAEVSHGSPGGVPNNDYDDINRNTTAPVLQVGALPFATLGLESSYATDCWGNKFTYFVTEHLTSTAGFAGATNLGTITISDNSNNLLTDAAYAVISHGQDGFGAAARNSTTSTLCALTTNRLDDENCEIANKILLAAPFNNGDNAGANVNYFDDLIIYEQKLRVVCKAQAITWGGNCTAEVPETVNGETINPVNDVSVRWTGQASVNCLNGNLVITNLSCYDSCMTTAWGDLSHGQTVTAYQNGYPPCGSSCLSQTRTCNNGTLSGSYTHTACTVQPCAPCSLPWGGQVPHGGSATAYAAPTVACTTSCSSQTRSCNNGTLSGSYMYGNCSVNPCRNCDLPWGESIAHGQSVTAYASAGSCGYNCAGNSQTRTCSDGTLSGSLTYASCSSSCVNCALPWGGQISHGQSVTAYSVDCGSGCPSQTRSCSNGSLSGSYVNGSCVASCGNDPCNLPWGGQISHGQSVTAYAAGSVACASGGCTSQTRTCSNGSLSGSYGYSGCSVQQCPSECSYWNQHTAFSSRGSCITPCTATPAGRGATVYFCTCKVHTRNLNNTYPQWCGDTNLERPCGPNYQEPPDIWGALTPCP